MARSDTTFFIYLGGPLTGKTSRLIQVYGDFLPDSAPLFLSFHDASAAVIRQRVESTTDSVPPCITTMHRFIFDLLHEFFREAGLVRDAAVVSATARAMIIRKAWEMAGGPAWRQYNKSPGAVDEITRIIDWISAQRTAFDIQTDELADSEFSRVYAQYIDLCREHRLLTFQEAALRALSLLEYPAVMSRLIRRFPAVIVDDLHYARPDQLALIERLCSAGIPCVAAAWSHDHHDDPGLARVWETVARLGATIERLPGLPPEVSGPVHAAANRAAWPEYPLATGDTAPMTILAAQTVEDEAGAIARSIYERLHADPTLHPEDILIVCADAALTGFIRRQFERTGIPVAFPVMPARHNPYILAGGWLVSWHNRGRRYEYLESLLRSPFLGLDPVDIRRLDRSARDMGVSVLDLSEADYPSNLRFPNETAAIMKALQTALAPREDDVSADWIEEAVEKLTDGAGTSAASDMADSWRAPFKTWVGRIRDLEETAATLSLPAREALSAIDRLADQIDPSAVLSGVRLMDGASVDSVRARETYVAGLSENATPRPERVLQMIEESGLTALFADGRPVVLPAHRNHAAWIEREARRFGVWLSRGTERLTLSTSRYSAGGQTQLPSPFFENLLGAHGEIDRDGRLRIDADGPWRLIHPARAGDFIPAEPSRMAAAMPASEVPEQVVRSAVHSASQIRTYLRCPLQFYYDRVLHLDSDEPPGTMRRGSLLHLVLCAALGGDTARSDLRAMERPPWLDDQDLLTQRALAALNAAWSGESAELPGGGRFIAETPWAAHFGPTLQRDATRRSVERVLRLWAEFETTARPDRQNRRPVFLETPFSFYIGGYHTIGRIDRIDEITVDGRTLYDVIDYKTGSAGADSVAAQIRKFLPEREDEAPTDYQLPIYALALAGGVDGLSAFPQTLSYINLDRLEKTTRGAFAAEASRSVLLTDHEGVDYKKGAVSIDLLRGSVHDRLVATLHALTTSPYPATPGYYCNFCGFRSACSRGMKIEG